MAAMGAAADAAACSMCYNTVAAAGENAIRALRSGVLVLLIPPLAIFAVLLAVAYRGRNRFCTAAARRPPAAILR